MPRIAKVFLVSIVLLIILDLALHILASYYFSAPFLTVLALGLCLYGFSLRLVLPLLLGVTLATSALSVRVIPRRLQIASVFVAGCLVFAALMLHHLHYPTYEKFTPSRPELDEVRHWLWENPPDGKNRVDRRKRMAVIEKACEQLRPEVFHDYEGIWLSKAWIESRGYERYFTYPTRTAAEIEAEYPALYYLGRATDQAMEDIRKTRVKHGLAVWQMYNMGYVFKTPEQCFAIDIHTRGAERLAKDLDFLLVTHRHHDHVSGPLEQEMIKNGKPVLTRKSFYLPDYTFIKHEDEFRFGDIRVKVDIGDHGWGKRVDDVLMFQVDCGESANNYTIYHTGDAANLAKMRPDKEVDIFIVHVGLATAGRSTSVKEAIRHLKPRVTFPSHVLELGHSPKLPDFGRAPFDYAFWTVRGIPTNEATVLTWGERWLAPGTVLEVEAELSE